MANELDPEEEDYTPVFHGEVRIFEMTPLRAAGFVAPGGEFYHVV